MTGDELIGDVLSEHDYREIRLRATLACSALSGDVAAEDRDLLLDALEEMADRYAEECDAKEEAEQSAADAEVALESDAYVKLRWEYEQLEQERDALLATLAHRSVPANVPCARCEQVAAIVAERPVAKPAKRRKKA